MGVDQEIVSEIRRRVTFPVRVSVLVAAMRWVGHSEWATRAAMQMLVERGKLKFDLQMRLKKA